MPSTQQLEFEQRGGGKSQADKILERLLETPGTWVHMPELYRVSGSFAVHSRINDLRNREFNIEHKNERQDDGTIHSFYRLVPKTEAQS